MSEEIIVSQPDMLQAITKAEIDSQVATAKQYPRDVKAALVRMEQMATIDPETAEGCHYCLRRNDKDGNVSLIEGVSVRMAEIIASSWGNLLWQARIIGNDGKFITAQGMCRDLESNFAVSVEVRRSISGKHGTFSNDMQVVTGNAACAIALRNAMLKVVPMALVKPMLNRIKDMAYGNGMQLEETRQKMLNYFTKLGVSKEQIYEYLGVERADDINYEMVTELRGLATAIKEGTTTVQETFKTTTISNSKATAQKAMAKAEAAMRKAMGATQPTTEVADDVPANVDPATGEVLDAAKEINNKKNREL